MANVLNIEHALTSRDKRPINTIENFIQLLRIYNITCRYNVISKRCEINIPGEEYIGDSREACSYARILSRMEEAGMATKNLDSYINYVASQNQYNPVLDWITSKTWDGNHRLAEFYNTITTDFPSERDALLFRWLIMCVAMADKDGLDSAGCLVLQGAQGVGKTWWFRKLVPDNELPGVVRTDASLDTKDKDSRMQILRYWIVELGEIDSTFRRSDISALKAFITAKQDDLRLPYAKTEIRLPRRTALCASVNPHYYLHDETGNRRYWTIPVKSIDSRHNIDMQQVWAEIYQYYKDGESWELTPKENDLLAGINDRHQASDPIFEIIAKKYDWESMLTHTWKTAGEIAEEIGIKHITQRDTRIIAQSILKLSNARVDKEKISRGYRVFALPHSR